MLPTNLLHESPYSPDHETLPVPPCTISLPTTLPTTPTTGSLGSIQRTARRLKSDGYTSLLLFILFVCLFVSWFFLLFIDLTGLIFILFFLSTNVYFCLDEPKREKSHQSFYLLIVFPTFEK